MTLWIIFGIFVICLTLESIASWQFIRGSKKNHPELWLHAGEPTLLGNGDIISAWPLNMYLFSKKYMEIDNNAAKEFATKIRLPFILSYFSTIISVAALLIYWLIFGNPD